MKRYNTKVTDNDIATGITTMQGCIYSCDMKRLLKGNKELEGYLVIDEVEVICDDAFGPSSPLKFIDLPDTLVAIGHNALPEGLEMVSSRFEVKAGLLVDVVDGRLIQCMRTEGDITLPIEVQTIGNRAFEGCRSLQSIFVPKGKKEYFEQLLDKSDYEYLKETLREED